MSLEENINSQIKEAMKAKDADRLRALRSIKSALMIAKTEKGASDELDEGKEVKILQKLAKQRKDSLTIYKEQNRADLAEVEEAELKIIEEFLPAMMSEDEVKAKVQAIIAQTGASSMADMGKVMGAAMGQLSGKADGGLISKLVKELLG